MSRSRAVADATLIVIAKAPIAGRSKTRLCPPCSPEQAASIAEAALVDTLGAVHATPAARRVLVLDGTPGPWLIEGFEVIPQRGDGLDERLASAFEDVAAAGAFLIGMDTPQVTPEDLMAGTNALMAPDIDAVLGEASDGGYWAVGLHAPDRQVFEQIAMSRSNTAALQRERFVQLGLRFAELDVLRDIDTFEDALAVKRSIEEHVVSTTNDNEGNGGGGGGRHSRFVGAITEVLHSVELGIDVAVGRRAKHMP